MPDILDYCKGRKAETFKAGAVLLTEGAQDHKLFVLIEGQVEVLRKGTQVSYVDEPGSLFGEMSVLLDMPQSATVQAITEVDYFVIDNAIEVLHSHPDWLWQIARLLAQRVNATTAMLTRDKSSEDVLILPQHFMSSWGDPTV